MRAEQRQIEGGAQGDKEKQQQEVAQRCEPRGDGLAVGRGCQRHAGKQTADFLAEPDEISESGEEGRLGDGEDDQKLRRPRQPLG